ncbi:unnamed protein product [Rhizophagus irregularis]|nr:unnamed protein product [Rhizophagus irregularis]
MTENKVSSYRSFKDKEKPVEVRLSNIIAAKAVGDAVRTSLGPKGMDKMIQTAKMLVDLSAAQDVEAGDGTTSVVVIAGALLGAAEKMLVKGIHPTTIAEAFQRAANNQLNFLQRFGGTIDDTELIDGLVLTQNVVKNSGGPTRIEKAKIGLIQFQLSPPKPDMENQIIVNDYRLMDKILKEERQYLLNMLVKDIERDEIEFICKSTGCKPIADIESFAEDKLGYAELIDEVQTSGARVVKITGVKHIGKTVSILCRGANSLVLEEAERSLHDALCVVRCLVKKKALIAGGGAPEIEVSQRLSEYAKTLKGMEAHCFEAFANALEVIPITLAENAGLNPINIVTELRNKHALGEKTAGINVKKGTISNILEENVIQPLLVSTSAIELSAETVKMLLKIDDLVQTR